MNEFNGAKLRLIRQFHNLSLADLGLSANISKQFLSRLENGGEGISTPLADDLAERLGVLPEFFFMPGGSPISEEQCHFRSNLTTKVTLRQNARARGEILNQVIGVLDRHLQLPTYGIEGSEPDSAEAIEVAATRFRDTFGLGRGPLSSMTRVAENAGAIVINVAGLAPDIDAISFATARPLIALNTDNRSGCRQRFGVAHELGHLALHTGVLTGDRLTENQANRFASALLLPRTTFASECRMAVRGTRLNWQGLAELKLRWKVSKAALIFRGRQLGILSEDQARSGYIGLKRHGEAIQEKEDAMVPSEQPDLLNDSLEVLNHELGIPLAAIARELRVTTHLLSDLLQRGRISMEASNVVSLDQLRRNSV
jgi:Zn-dependent peptidase ImmA (M78 family)/transcriptional regulator with XRE-family HTH domain